MLTALFLAFHGYLQSSHNVHVTPYLPFPAVAGQLCLLVSVPTLNKGPFCHRFTYLFHILVPFGGDFAA